MCPIFLSLLLRFQLIGFMSLQSRTMSCAQITVQEYILTKPYSSMYKISTMDSSCSQTIPNQLNVHSVLEEVTGEQPSGRLTPILPEMDVEINSPNKDYNIDQSQCNCIQSPCECQLSKLELPSTDDISQTDSQLSATSHHETDGDNFVPISLADYLEKLTKQLDNREKTPQKLLPRECINHFQAPKMQYTPENKSHLSTSSLSSSSIQQFDFNTNESIIGHMKDNHDLRSKSSSYSVDYYNYLKKRRVFLIDRLSSRYSELMKLLNEELELTGRPPTNYLQHTHAYYEAQEASKRIHANELQNSNTGSNVSKTDDSNQQKTNKGQLSKQINAAYVRSSRLQETGFMLSPRVIRKATIKLSPSVNCLLKSSHSSLFTDDSVNQNREQTINRWGDESHQTSKVSRNPNSSLKDNENEILKSTSSVRKVPNENGILQKLNKSLPLSFRSRFKTNLIQFNNELCTSASSPSLCDTGMFIRQTEKAGTPQPPTTTTVLTSMSTATLSSLLSTGLTNTNQLLTNNSDNLTTTSATHITNHMAFQNYTQDIFNPYNCTDIQKAISWLEVELNAVKNIMLANINCANENKRNRASRKAYKLAAKRNQETITSLENQICSLQIYAEKQNKLSNDAKCESISVYNSDHSMGRSALTVSTSSLSSPSFSYSSSSSLLNSLVMVNEHASSGQSPFGVPPKTNIRKIYSGRFPYSPSNNISIKNVTTTTATAAITPTTINASITRKKFLTSSFNTEKPSQFNTLHNSTAKNSPVAISHSQLNTIGKMSENKEKLTKSSHTPLDLIKRRENNISQNTGVPVEQINIQSCETDLPVKNNDTKSDNDDESEIYYEHERNSVSSHATKPSSSTPSSIVNAETDQSLDKTISEERKCFCDIGIQTTSNENHQNGIFKDNLNLARRLTDHNALNGNYENDVHRWSIISAEMKSHQHQQRQQQQQQQQCLLDTPIKLRNNHQEPFLTNLYMNGNNHQELNEQKSNLLLHRSKPPQHPCLSSSSSWSSANSLCSIGLIGQCYSTENTDGCLSTVNKGLHNSVSTHNVWISPHRTVVNVDLDDSNHSSGHKTQSQGNKQSIINQSNYDLRINQQNWTNYSMNKTIPYNRPCEQTQFQSPMFV
ncbi:unnamed protein product [Heterobilharzia americana]|nr:unnamed protein product [Heterobilharzia americana]